ncbi:DUF7344 domain-containing protein [Halorussus halophilus]|uniref:DUF7344 domain-containing protein n=1 Tax=Halorussus halophilus TaxID=2650975 RepID=UPI0013016BCB|nr:hypothetical protein [Halorussus halophilus]
MMDADSPDASEGYVGTERDISPTLDATLDLLSNRRRRYVLYYLRKQGGTVSLAELAERITEWDDSETQSTEKVVADLYHSHLPRMDDAGVVSFDERSNAVTLTEDRQSPLSEYLDLAAREENLV